MQDTKISELDSSMVQRGREFLQLDELKHYGVVGMKWGVRRARKKGIDVAYKSHGLKKYERRLAKQQAGNASAAKIAKTKSKLEQYKTRDRNRESYAAKTSIGKSIAKQLVMGPLGAGNYNRLRAAGKGRLSSMLVSNIITGTVFYPVTVAYTKHVENKAARRQNRKRDRRENSK